MLQYLRHVGKSQEVWFSADPNQEGGFESWLIKARKGLPR